MAFYPQAPVAPVRGASRFANAVPEQPKNPRLMPGNYVLGIHGTHESNIPGKDPYFKIDVEVVQSDCSECPPGYRTVVDWCMNAKSMSSSIGKMQAFAVATMGCDTNDEYKAGEAGIGYYPGQLLDMATVGQPVFAGKMVCCQVTFGKEVLDKETHQPTGDYYRNYAWTPYRA